MRRAGKPKSQKQKKKSDSPSISRLKEMLGVLRQHDIVHGVNPEKLRLILEDMGPTYVKLGQIMSMRSDILPQAYCDELTRLRADVKPMPFSQVQQVIEQEYGASLQSIFSSIDPEPLGAASIAQVHAATLKDKTRVVVKVQRPGIRETMAQDITCLLYTSVPPGKKPLPFWKSPLLFEKQIGQKRFHSPHRPTNCFL